MHRLEAELEQRWHAMFSALAAGDDVPPSDRLRTEGMMEAALLLDILSVEAQVKAMDDCYQAAFGRALADEFGEDWQDFFQFPQIPAMAQRAPVYPSTKD
jgi:hypothetical protein